MLSYMAFEIESIIITTMKTVSLHGISLCFPAVGKTCLLTLNTVINYLQNLKNICQGGNSKVVVIKNATLKPSWHVMKVMSPLLLYGHSIPQ